MAGDSPSPISAPELAQPNPELAWSQHLVVRARRALDSGDLAVAAELWTKARLWHPDDPAGYIGQSTALNRARKYADADAISTEAVARFPANEHVIANHAWLAQNRGDWDEAVARWRHYRERFPDHPVGYSAAGVALRHAENFDEADQILTGGLRRHPDHAELLGNYAWVAHRRGDWPEALSRWGVYKTKFPAHIVGYSSLGIVLREMQSFDEADAVLREGLSRYPDNSELVGNYAWVAYQRHDWPEALRRWETFREKFPADPLGDRQVMLVLGELGRFGEAAALSRPAALPQTNASTPANLMLAFESLGENCEFGVVQRHFGAEPLGLLRFTSTPPRLLTAALRDRFAGVGSPENTTLTEHNGEYMTRDKRYHMSMHTFIPAVNDDRTKRFANLCRRLVFLRDKLIGDLEEAEKHFVYGSRSHLADEDIRGLWEAMQAYGKNRLLLVHPAEASERPGTMRQLEDGLIVGFIDRVSVEAPSFDLWLKLCRDSHDVWSAASR